MVSEISANYEPALNEKKAGKHAQHAKKQTDRQRVKCSHSAKNENE